MKNSYIQFTISCVFICLTTRVYGGVAEYPLLDRGHSKSSDPKPLTVELAGPKNLLVGERPNLRIEIANVSDKPIEFVQPLDGSWHNWRYPYMSVEVYDESDKALPIRLAGRCGNMNPIVPDDIKRLNPGEKMGFYIGWPFSGTGFEKPGKYNIVLSYDLRAPNTDAWVIAGRFSDGKTNSKITTRIKRIPKLLIKSKPLGIEIHSVTKNMLESMILEYYHERPLFDFVVKDLKSGKWRVCDIWQSNGWISCLVEFADGYTSPPRPKYVTKGHWFEQGRHLFEPSRKSPNLRVHALPNEASIFKLHLPQDTAILSKKHEWLQSLTAKTEVKSNKRLVPVVVHAQVKPEVIKAGEPIMLNISISNGFNESIYHNTFGLKPTTWNGETINISLVDIYRDDKLFNLYYARPKVDVPDRISGMGTQEIKAGETLSIKTDARKWKLRDGWLPGRYSIVLRVDNLTADEHCKLSVCSDPVVFEIINSDLESYFEDKTLESNKF